MPVPLIAAAAAAAAARIAAKKVAQRAVGGITGIGAKSVNPTYRNVGPSVKIKPPAKTVGNPPNDAKSWESVISSISRGGVGRTVGKAKDARVASSKKPTGQSK